MNKTPIQKSIAEIETMRNEKIKEIAEFDGLEPYRDTGLYWYNGYTRSVEQLPYLTDLNSLHRVALDVMDRIPWSWAYNDIYNALQARPINGQYTDLVDAVYDAIVYLKQHDLCQPK